MSEPSGEPCLDYIQCQDAGCDILLQFYKVLLLKLGKGYMKSLCYSYFFLNFIYLFYCIFIYFILLLSYVCEFTIV